MSTTWAYLYLHRSTDPVADRSVVERAGQRTLLVPVADSGSAPKIAADLVDEGVQLIELCGGFSLAQAARVTEAVAGRVPVGHVTFSVESLAPAAAFSENASAGS